MPSERSLSRRAFLATAAPAGAGGLAGCFEFDSEDNAPTTVETLELGNGNTEPWTASVVIRSPEEVLYWETHELGGYESSRNGLADPDEDDHVTLVGGPIGNGETPLWIDITADDPGENGLSEEDRTVTTRPLGENGEGCVYVLAYRSSLGDVTFSIKPAEDVDVSAAENGC